MARPTPEAWTSVCCDCSWPAAEEHRLVEIALHPGEAAAGVSPEQEADGWRDPLAARRPGELQMLVSSELPALLESSGWRLGRLTCETASG